MCVCVVHAMCCVHVSEGMCISSCVFISVCVCGVRVVRLRMGI